MAGNIYPDWTPSDYTLSGWLAGQESSDRDWALKQRMGLDNLYRQGELDAQQLQNALDRQTQADKIRKITGEADSAVAKGTMDQFKVPYEKQGIIDADKLNKGMNVLRDMLETFDTSNDINSAHQAAIAAGADPNKLGHLKDRKAIADALQRAEQRLMDTPEHQQKRQLQREEEYGKNWREIYGENQANYRARLNADRFGGGGGSSYKPPTTLQAAAARANDEWAKAGYPQEGPLYDRAIHTWQALKNYEEGKVKPTSILNPAQGGFEAYTPTPMPNVPPGVRAQQPQPRQQQKEIVLPDGTKIRRKQ